jgi:hypothetical protein
MLRRCPAALFAVEVFAAGAFGAQLAPVFRAEARIVVVHVAVHGAAGEMVTDLGKSAFTVFENGKPQPISLFLHLSQRARHARSEGSSADHGRERQREQTLQRRCASAG